MMGQTIHGPETEEIEMVRYACGVCIVGQDHRSDV